jgi:NAD-dependent deacetylase
MPRPLIAVLTGAGISAESGLRTFRDSDGLWEGYNVEEVATPRAWRANQRLVLDFYNQRRRDIAAARPNRAHLALAELEKDFDVRIVTQNIDDLHERAGSTRVLHLHGDIFKMRSDRQQHEDSLAREIRDDMPYGAQAPDGGYWRPHIVWFEEAVPAIMEAADIMRQADIFILVGTSLVVYPAAGLVDYLPAGIPKYVVDKNIPVVRQYMNIIPIEKPATEGMEEVRQLLSGRPS